MFTRILVPLDGSTLAERAIPYARQIGHATGATLHLVRVIDPLGANPIGSMGLAAPANWLLAERGSAEGYLEALRATLAAEGLSVRTAGLIGNAAAELLDYERAAHIDLVLICSHGHTGLKRFATGSVAARLIEHGAAPVLVLRAFGDPVSLEHALVPLDGSPLATLALPAVEFLATRVIQRVTLLRVHDAGDRGLEAEEYLENAARRLESVHLPCQLLLDSGRAAERIIAHAGSDGFVVMATHGRSGLSRWALGSVADRVAHGGVAAVLLVRQIGATIVL